MCDSDVCICVYAVCVNACVHACMNNKDRKES